MTTLSWDFGTSSVRACLYSAEGDLLSIGQENLPCFYPKSGWVEQDPKAIWQKGLQTADQALQKKGLRWSDVQQIGLTNQRETTIVWDPKKGEAVYPAIVWQDRRTELRCQQLQEKKQLIQEKTGLLPDPYFSATKLEWILHHCSLQQPLFFGTVDSWIVWKLSGRHVTDQTNASRTLLFTLQNKEWDFELCRLFSIPDTVSLPEVYPSSFHFADTDSKVTGGKSIPIRAIAGDQQAALYAACGHQEGVAKSTFGTGSFLMMPTAKKVLSKNGLLTTLSSSASVCYALEGSVFFSGALLDWAVKKLGIAKDVEELDLLAHKANKEVFCSVIPAFVGLGAPDWRPDVRGMIDHLEPNCGKEEIAAACFDAIAFETKRVVDAMKKDSGQTVATLVVDGGVVRSFRFCQLLADVLEMDIEVADNPNGTVWGAALLAGVPRQSSEKKRFFPENNQWVSRWQMWVESLNLSKKKF